MRRAGLRMAVFLALAAMGRATTAADLARRIAALELDPEECYRVRDLTLAKEDLRLYYTDGYMIFAKPVEEVRTAAVFVADVEGGDAEVLLMPPNKGERQSLASFTGAPNLNEHFKTSVLIFTDDSYRVLAAQMRDNPANKKAAEMGLLLAPAWRDVVRNLSASFESRLVLDLLSSRRPSYGFLFAAIGASRLGNFDLVYDPRGTQQISVGQVTYRDDRTYFDIWTTFESRSVRDRAAAPAPGARGAEFALSDYRIDATLAAPDLRLQVVTRVKLRPAAGSERAFPFEISGRMRVTSALIDGQPAEVFERESMRSNLIRNTGNNLFLLLPPAPLEAGREYPVEIRHEGSVISDAGNRVYAVGSRGNWYPGRGAQFCHYDLTFRYPKELDLVASGEPVSDVTEGDLRITRRRTAAPVRFAGFNLGQFEQARLARGGVTVEVYANRGLERALQPRPREPVVTPPSTWPPRSGRRDPFATLPAAEAPPPPPNPTARLQELAGEVAGAVDFMTARLGPLPLRTLTVSPVPGSFGQGFPGLIYLSTLSYFAPRDRPLTRLAPNLQVFFTEILAAHETAHQWWGNIVTAAGYQDEWMLEALANYCALMYLEKRKGPRALESALEQYRADLLAKVEGRSIESAGPISLGTRLASSQTPTAWRTITYGKGSWILHMLRRRLGDERFNAFLGELRRRFEGKPLRMEEVRLLAAGMLPPKSPDPKLEAFFDQWVYATGIPTLQMTYSVKGKAPAVKVTGVVTQSDVGEDFATLVPIEIQTGKTRLTHWVRTGSEPAPFSIALRQAPTKVLLDPAGSVLALRK